MQWIAGIHKKTLDGQAAHQFLERVAAVSIAWLKTMPRPDKLALGAELHDGQTEETWELYTFGAAVVWCRKVPNLTARMTLVTAARKHGIVWITEQACPGPIDWTTFPD